MPRFTIQHLTQYQYKLYAQYSANRLMLYPLVDDFQKIIRQEIFITGNPIVSTYQDYYGNEVGTFTLIEPHLTLTIDSHIEVETRTRTLPIDTLSVHEAWQHLVTNITHLPIHEFLVEEAFSYREDVQKVYNEVFQSSLTPLQLSMTFCDYIFTTYKYVKGITSVDTTIEEIWQHKSGVCQDFAHVLLMFLRKAKIPSRYVSGYICPHQNGMRGEGATHAWVEVYLPNYGWLGIDPTNNCMVNDTHVRLAVGRYFSDCSPVKGTYRGGAEHQLHVRVIVSYEDGLQMQDNTDSNFLTDAQRETQFQQTQQ
jgi:transglutaminase-like putative cysteine protease